MDTNRRHFIKTALGTSGAILLASRSAQAVVGQCGLTPAQGSGPFYPGEKRFDVIDDLTQVPGRTERALGQVVYVIGQVQDRLCQPIANANVEIWQACESGRYNNPNDPNPAALDPNFRYWAEAYTGKKGEYVFKTIIPGEYPAAADWVRPPHIHFRVSALGYHELITQMYFKGNRFNEGDEIFKRIPKAEQDRVLIDFVTSEADLEPGSLTGRFDLTLRSVKL